MAYSTATVTLTNSSTVTLTFSSITDDADLKQLVQSLIKGGGAWDTNTGTTFYPSSQWLSVCLS
jgi:hypothetical protein